MESRTIAMSSGTDYESDVMPRLLTLGEIKSLVGKCHGLYSITREYLKEVRTRPDFHYAKVASTTISLATITLHLTWEHTGTFQGVSTVFFWTTLAVWPLGLHRPVSAVTSATIRVLENITIYLGQKSKDCGLTDLVINLIVSLALIVINGLELVGSCLAACTVLIGYFGLVVVLAVVYVTLLCAEAYSISKEAWGSILINVNKFHHDFQAELLLRTGPPSLFSRKKREQACRRLAAKRVNRRRWQAEAQWTVKLAVERATLKAHVEHAWDLCPRSRPFVLMTPKRTVRLTILKNHVRTSCDFCPGSCPSIRTKSEPKSEPCPDWATLRAHQEYIWDFSPRAHLFAPTTPEEIDQRIILEAHVGNAWDFSPRAQPSILTTPERADGQTECSIDFGDDSGEITSDDETGYSADFVNATHNASNDTTCHERDAPPKYFWTRTCNIGVGSNNEPAFVLVRRCFDGCGIWVDCINDDYGDKTDSCIVPRDEACDSTNDASDGITYINCRDEPKYIWMRMCSTGGHEHRAADKIFDDATESIMIRECLRGCRRWYDASQDPRDKSCEVCERIERLCEPDEEGDESLNDGDSGEMIGNAGSESEETGSVILTPLYSDDEDEDENEDDGNEADDEGADDKEMPVDYGSDLDEETLREIYAECGDWFL